LITARPNCTTQARLAFFAVFVLASIVITAVLWQYASFYWAVAGAVPAAIAVAWAVLSDEQLDTLLKVARDALVEQREAANELNGGLYPISENLTR